VYNYDAANRLKEVGVGGSNTYGYDGDGMRVRQTSGGAAMFYVRSSVLRNVAMEVTATGGAIRAYVYQNGRVIAESTTDGQFYWLHTNHLNSARAMTDINGTLVYKGQFGPYGDVMMEWSFSGNTWLNTRKFTGYERDQATGLDYANARMYKNGRGRFMQSDPAGTASVKTDLPQSLNRYAYAGNDPINNIDPRGEDWSSWIRFFAESACTSQGGVFGGFGFLPSTGNIGFLCYGEQIINRPGTRAEESPGYNIPCQAII